MKKMANENRLIDANDALKKIQLECSNYSQTSELTYAGLAIAKKIIEDAPTVEAVEVVHGRWIGETGGYMWRQNCSVCNGPVYNKMKPYYNYCPYCGAKMDGDKHE
jgi:hypothetical protein